MDPVNVGSPGVILHQTYDQIDNTSGNNVVDKVIGHECVKLGLSWTCCVVSEQSKVESELLVTSLCYDHDEDTENDKYCSDELADKEL